MNTLEPLVSVIIPNYNQAHFIRNAIQSVLCQSYKSVELIVVDDGSTDKSASILKEFEGQAKIIFKSNGGAASARNEGIRQSKGDFLCFLDADDEFLTEYIASQMNRIEKNPSDLVYCQMILINERSEFLGTTTELRDGNFRRIMTSEFGGSPFSPSSFLIRRTILKNSISWNEDLSRYSEDFEFIAKCAFHTDFLLNPVALVKHTEHENSLTSKTELSYFFDSLSVMRNVLKYYGISSIKVYIKGFIRIFLIFSKSALKERSRKLSFRK